MTKFIPDNPKATYKLQFLPRVDADAMTAIAAAKTGGGSFTSGQESAINTAVRSLKNAGIWTKLLAWYPIVGGTAGAHAVNFKSPGTNNVTWVNSPTQDASGVKSNGVNSYGLTGITPTAIGSTGGMGCICREVPSASGAFMGSYFTGGGNGYEIYANSSGALVGIFGSGTQATSASASAQDVMMNRSSSTSLKLYRNGALVSTVTTATTAGVSSLQIALLGENADGVVGYFSTKYMTQFRIHTSLSDAEAASLYSILRAVEVAFGRAV